MRLDPQARAVLARIEASNTPAYRQLGVHATRELYRANRLVLGSPTMEPAQVMDLVAESPSSSIPVRVYRPAASDSRECLPGVVYFHGGGWVLGDLDTHDEICRALANLAGCAVVSVDYRLAPEHKFPAAVDDAVEATCWVSRMAPTLGIDPARLAVAGDSAGATLAAVVALTLRDMQGPALSMQVLVYPSTDLATATASHDEFAEGYGLTRDNTLWFRNAYLAGEADALDWRASPLRAQSFAGLPSAYIIAAGFDPLRDEAHLYAQRLQEAGVAVTYELFEGMIHGFLSMSGVIAAARHAMYRIAQALRPGLGLGPQRIRP